MTKKLLITLSIFALFANGTKASDNNSATHDEGVVINGVRWATRNVGEPGTFVENPRDKGMLFQWNRRVGWGITDEEMAVAWNNGWRDGLPTDEDVAAENWDSSICESPIWEKENCPCPPGWRIPTREEMQELIVIQQEIFWQDERDWHWRFRPYMTLRNARVELDWGGDGADGAFFGSTGRIFLPAAGWRDRNGVYRLATRIGRHYSITPNGLYWWSDTQDGEGGRGSLLFSRIDLGVSSGQGQPTAVALSVRCVAINPNIPDENNEETKPNTPTYDRGVVIRGIRWATRNVATPGTFAENPEDVGMFFQWNRRRGWATTGDVRRWRWRRAAASGGTEWTKANDPCPPGWRVPTREELEALTRSRRMTWTTHNGVHGRLIGFPPNEIFLPAVGIRQYDGTPYLAGEFGFYWSSSTNDEREPVAIQLSRNFVGSSGALRIDGFSVRCVAIE